MVMTEHPEARFYWAVTDGSQSSTATVGPRGDQHLETHRRVPTLKRVWSSGVLGFSTICVVGLGGGASPPFAVSALHWGGVSPTISMPCCWSWARSKAFSFFNSSISGTKKEKNTLTSSSLRQSHPAPSSELTEQTFSVPGIKEWYVQPCVKTPCPQPTGLSNLVVCHLCYISPEWNLNSLPPTPTEGDFDYVNNNILLSALRALDSMGRNGSLGAVRLHSTSECISMQLALTQAWCILFPQSL